MKPELKSEVRLEAARRTVEVDRARQRVLGIEAARDTLRPARTDLILAVLEAVLQSMATTYVQKYNAAVHMSA